MPRPKKNITTHAKVVELKEALGDAEEVSPEGYAVFTPSVRERVQAESLDRVIDECENLEKSTSQDLTAMNKRLRFDQKQLKTQRDNLFATLANNQAKAARINQTLQRIAFRMESEDSINDGVELLANE